VGREIRNQVNCADRLCPLSKTCSRLGVFVYESEYASPQDPLDVLFVLDHASLNETVTRLSMTSQEALLIREAMVDFPRLKWGFTHLVRGWPAEESTLPDRFAFAGHLLELSERDLRWARTAPFGSHAAKKEVIQRCNRFLQQETAAYRPKRIVVLGNTVKEALLPFEQRSITNLYHVEKLHVSGAKLSFISSPISVVKNPSGRTEWITRLKTIVSGQPIQRDVSIPSATILKTMAEVKDYIKQLQGHNGDVAIDCETDNLNKKYKNRIATVQFSTDHNSGYVLPIFHRESPFSPDEIEEIKTLLYDLFTVPSSIKHWVGHNIKFECNIFKATFDTPLLSAPLYDTQIGAFLLDENRRERVAEYEHFPYSLKQLVLDYLNYAGYDQGVLKIREEGTLFDLELEKLAVYGCIDTAKTLALMAAELEEAETQNYTGQLLNLMYSLYTPMILLFNEIEQNGFPVERSYIRRLLVPNSPILQEVKTIEGRLGQTKEGQAANNLLLGFTEQGSAKSGVALPLFRKPWAFDLAKRGHPQTLFFKVLGLPKKPQEDPKKDMLGWSVDKAWQDINAGNEFVKMFTEWVGLRKMYDSFVTKLYSRVDPADGDPDCVPDSAVRANFSLASVVTGRVACQNPNLQACVSEDTLLLTNTGITTAGTAILKERWYNGRQLEKIKQPFNRMSEEIFRVTTQRNLELDCTADHLHHTVSKSGQYEVKTTSALTTDDYLVCSLRPWLLDFSMKEPREQVLKSAAACGRLTGGDRMERIPRWILDGGFYVIREYLCEFFAAAASFDHRTARISASDKQFIRQLHTLLLGFGVPSSFSKRQYKSGTTTHYLTIHGPAFTVFLDRISGKSSHFSAPVRPMNRHIEAEFPNELKPLVEAGVELLKVKSVESYDHSNVYDATLPYTATFWANGFLTHNCPRADNEAKKSIKNIFRARPKQLLIQLDFKANEMRWAGIVAQDPAMADNFNQGKKWLDAFRANPENEELLTKATHYSDIHRLNASRAFNKPIEEITKNERQAAKGCLAAGSLVNARRGLVPIELIEPGDEVWTGEKWVAVKDLWRPKSQIYRVSFHRGQHWDVSADHKFLVFDPKTITYSFCGLEDLADKYMPIWRNNIEPDRSNVRLDYALKLETPYDRGGVTASINAKTHPLKYPKKMSKDLAWLLGALIAEGGSTQKAGKRKYQSMTFAQSNKTEDGRSYFAKFLACHERLFGVPASVNDTRKPPHRHIVRALVSVYVKKFVDYCGYIGGAYNKEIPWSILQSSRECQKEFIRGYLSGDGSAPKVGVRSVRCSSASYMLIKQMQTLLLQWGICSNMHSEKRVWPDGVTEGVYWVLDMTGNDYERFFSEIGESQFIKYRQRERRHQKDSIPGLLMLAESRFEKKGSQERVHPNGPLLNEISYEELQKHWFPQKLENGKNSYHLRQWFNDDEAKLIDFTAESKPLFCKFKSTTLIEEKETEVYDLVLEDNDRFFDGEAPYFVSGGAVHLDCTFGVLYDSSEKSVAEMFNMPPDKVKVMFENFYTNHYAIKEWKWQTKCAALRNGYAESPHGRRRRLPVLSLFRDRIKPENYTFRMDGVDNDYRSLVADALRQSTNSVIQGISSDCAMIGGNLFREWLKNHHKPWTLHNAVHDSAVFSVPPDDLEEALQVAEKCFTTDLMDYMNATFDIEFNLPIEIDFDIGVSWGSMQGWNFDPRALSQIREEAFENDKKLMGGL